MTRVEGRGIKRRGGRPPKPVEEKPSEAGQREGPAPIKLAYVRFLDPAYQRVKFSS